MNPKEFPIYILLFPVLVSAIWKTLDDMSPYAKKLARKPYEEALGFLLFALTIIVLVWGWLYGFLIFSKISFGVIP